MTTPYTPPPALLPLLTPVECEKCGGMGTVASPAHWQHKLIQCPTCHGTGRVLPVSAVVIPAEIQDCLVCESEGHTDEGLCPQCNGDGYTFGNCPLSRSGGVCEVRLVRNVQWGFSSKGHPAVSGTETQAVRIRVGSVEVMQGHEVIGTWNEQHPTEPLDPEVWVWVCSDLRLEVTA